MGVEVIRDLAHDAVVVPPVLAEATGGGFAEASKHVVDFVILRFSPVLAPDHHRRVADFAVGHPANLVFVVPMGQPGRLAELATPFGAHWVLRVTVEPCATVVPAPGDSEETRPFDGPVPWTGFKPTDLNVVAAAEYDCPMTDGTVAEGPKEM